MITDESGISSVGLALLKLYRNVLTPPEKIELKVQGKNQFLVVTGPKDTLVSNSFGWGRPDERTNALFRATVDLGLPLPLEMLQHIPPTQERLIQMGK
jgi:hypothetical protein